MTESPHPEAYEHADRAARCLVQNQPASVQELKSKDPDFVGNPASEYALDQTTRPQYFAQDFQRAQRRPKPWVACNAYASRIHALEGTPPTNPGGPAARQQLRRQRELVSLRWETSSSGTGLRSGAYSAPFHLSRFLHFQMLLQALYWCLYPFFTRVYSP